jgi:hypothetical protein
MSGSIYYSLVFLSDPFFSRDKLVVYVILFVANFVALARASASYIIALEFSDAKFEKLINFITLLIEGLLLVFAVLLFYLFEDIMAHTTAIGVIGGSTLFITYFFMPESPAWLYQN